MRTIIAISGGRTRHRSPVFDGPVRIQHLRASNGAECDNNSGIGCVQGIEWLLRIHAENPNATYFSYLFQFEINCILANGMPQVAAKRLGVEGCVYFQIRGDADLWYYLEYQPKHMFTVARCQLIDGRYKRLQTMTIYDGFGFFNQALPDALAVFGLPDMPTSNNPEYYTEKSQRIALLMTLFDMELKRKGINLSQYHGAGSIAAWHFRKHSVKQFLYRPRSEAEVGHIMRAFFGGRSQAQIIGPIEPCVCYDMVSSYPSAMVQLKQFTRCVFVRKLDASYPFAVYHVRFKFPTGQYIYPFPWRNIDGSIEYPQSGEGWYWQPEVLAAIEVYGADCVHVCSGYRYETSDVRPFAFIEDLFSEREVMRKRKNVGGDMPQKLALNALYGKLVQCVGQPTYQCYAYGGWITSHVRSRMFLAAMSEPASIAAFCTDGLISTKALQLPVARELGFWKRAEYSSAFVLKAGMYSLHHGRRMTVRLRGFTRQQVRWVHVLEDWRRYGPTGRYAPIGHEFIGIKSIGQGLWGSYRPMKREIEFWPMVGYPEPIGPHTFRVLASCAKAGCSHPFEPKETEASEFEWLDFHA